MLVKLMESQFDPWAAVAQFEDEMQTRGQFGASSVFVGTMRDFNAGQGVKAMYLEHYPGMTNKHLDKILTEAHQQWDLIDSLVMHRYGDINPSDTIVLIATWSAHRDESFKACRFIIEELKQRAPFWKKEFLAEDGSHRWVSSNS